MQAAASGGYGSFSGMSSGSNCFTIDICPDLLIAGIAAAAAAAFFLIYQGITMASRRRRRRNVDPTNASIVFDMLTLGKENSSRTMNVLTPQNLDIGKENVDLNRTMVFLTPRNLDIVLLAPFSNVTVH